MNVTGEISKSYTVEFKRINLSPFAVIGRYADADIHCQQVSAGNSAGAKSQVIAFQKEQMNRKIEIISVVPDFPEIDKEE